MQLTLEILQQLLDFRPEGFLASGRSATPTAPRSCGRVRRRPFDFAQGGVLSPIEGRRNLTLLVLAMPRPSLGSSLPSVTAACARCLPEVGLLLVLGLPSLGSGTSPPARRLLPLLGSLSLADLPIRLIVYRIAVYLAAPCRGWTSLDYRGVTRLTFRRFALGPLLPS